MSHLSSDSEEEISDFEDFDFEDILQDLKVEASESWKPNALEKRFTHLAAECIILHLDPNIRWMLSLLFPTFRRFEAKLPMYLDKLEISSSIIQVNDRRYKFGEIHEIEKVKNLETREMTETERSIDYQNMTGGLGWSSLESDTMEPGDVKSCLNYWSVLEQQRERIAPEVRRCFFESLEKYLTFEQPVNPMEPFEDVECPEFVRTWIERFFERVGGPTDAGLVLTKHPLVVYEKTIQRDDLARRCPRAYIRIAETVENMKKSGDCRLSTLQSLTFVPIIIPHYNAFSVLRPSNFPVYLNRLPKGLSLRRAFKKFALNLFNGRSNITAREFGLEGNGIIPLPVGLKLDCSNITSPAMRTITCGSVLRNANHIKLWAYGKNESEHPIIRNCKKLEIFHYVWEENEASLSILSNEVLCLGFGIVDSSDFFKVLNDWSKNENRQIGSKLFMFFNKSIVEDVIDSFFGENRKFNEIGFRRHNDEGVPFQSYRLPQNGNKFVEIRIREDDGNQFSLRFLELYCVQRYFHLEVISLN